MVTSHENQELKVYSRNQWRPPKIINVNIQLSDDMCQYWKNFENKSSEGAMFKLCFDWTVRLYRVLSDYFTNTNKNNTDHVQTDRLVNKNNKQMRSNTNSKLSIMSFTSRVICVSQNWWWTVLSRCLLCSDSSWLALEDYVTSKSSSEHDRENKLIIITNPLSLD